VHQALVNVTLEPTSAFEHAEKSCSLNSPGTWLTRCCGPQEMFLSCRAQSTGIPTPSLWLSNSTDQKPLSLSIQLTTAALLLSCPTFSSFLQLNSFNGKELAEPYFSLYNHSYSGNYSTSLRAGRSASVVHQAGSLTPRLPQVSCPPNH